MKVRCKVTCTFKMPANGGGEYIHLSPVISGSKENEEFFKYTPGGTFQFYSLNQKAADAFVTGKEYYLDLTPCEG